MQGELRQLLIKPETLDKEGIETKPKYAAINLVVPLDTEEQREAVKNLQDVVSTEMVLIEIKPAQARMTLDQIES